MMLLHGPFSLTTPPAKWVEQRQVEQNDYLCFWSASLPYTFGAQVLTLPDGPLRVGETKRAVLCVTAEAGTQLRVGEPLSVGSARQEPSGHLVLRVLARQAGKAVPQRVLPLSRVKRGSLTPTEQKLFQRIEEWVRLADQLCSALREAFRLDFTRIGRLERNMCMGRQGQRNGIAYAFHGIGCYFETNNLRLDVDFDSQGDWRGFDLWRLQSFIDWNYPQLGFSAQRIEQGVDALLAKQWLYQVDRPYDHSFYYVTLTQ
ncbi:hypothetical protein [Hymenobacter sp. YC55]|uniref:DUF6896 domain-containing protein n=1 Tax=Hymenobacter sp. YC55 TaxID=3034019 RepID=UPI0023F63B63|nr:hypothetical protein [Hymenobacter sp. YC55]MDF7815139.1 hypothetical protein [Hymenobacter sp. YC55]